jgi:hypothetical protein
LVVGAGGGVLVEEVVGSEAALVFDGSFSSITALEFELQP